jgi:hypothetical protein
MKFRIGLAVGCVVCEIGVLSCTLHAILFQSLRVAAVCVVFAMGSLLPCLLMYCGIKDEWERRQATSRARLIDAPAR